MDEIILSLFRQPWLLMAIVFVVLAIKVVGFLWFLQRKREGGTEKHG